MHAVGTRWKSFRGVGHADGESNPRLLGLKRTKNVTEITNPGEGSTVLRESPPQRPRTMSETGAVLKFKEPPTGAFRRLRRAIFGRASRDENAPPTPALVARLRGTCTVEHDAIRRNCITNALIHNYCVRHALLRQRETETRHTI